LEHYSEIISKVLRYSNNLAAESIGQAAARRLHGGPLTLYESATVVKTWCQQTLPHVDWDGFHSMNHSGLSSATRHTPRQLAEILRYAWVNPPDGARFSDLLSPPHWGKEEEPLRQRVKAKSGTLSYADGLIGYLTTKRERDFGFVILVTDFLKRAELDATFDVRIADSPPQAHEWTARVKAFEQALIADWVQRY
jgi:D-alanyl-D-alanine carboxypeptidase/D-alanyl-D-alanine-endopeptidase (penicillin-binding protein 4)